MQSRLLIGARVLSLYVVAASLSICPAHAREWGLSNNRGMLAQADQNPPAAPSYQLPPYSPSYPGYPPQPQPGYDPYGHAPATYVAPPPSYNQPPTYNASASYGSYPESGSSPGYPSAGNYPSPNGFYPPGGGYPGYAQNPSYFRPAVTYAPQGLMLPLSLTTAISTQVAKVGDFVQASVSQNVSLGNYAYIPAGTVVTGRISDAEAGRRLSRSGALSIQFNQMQLPGGNPVPISAHLLGSIGKYKDVGQGGNDLYRGEGWGTKLGQFALRGGLGAGLGAGLGTAVGAIAGGGSGAGRGAWSGAAIGGGIGAADMLLRKGKDVLIPSGTAMQLQLDAPVAIAGGGGPQSQPPQGAGVL